MKTGIKMVPANTKAPHGAFFISVMVLGIEKNDISSKNIKLGSCHLKA